MACPLLLPDAMHHDIDTPASEPTTLSTADLASVHGGFMQFLQGAMGLAGNLVNQFGDDKAKQGFGMASNIIGQIGGMFGGGGGGGGAG
ncbi:MAG TPA: hypothetical protein VFQ53_35140 [Kofleriaceae bacterium]|nr:hypothetical protein [Kofleriaceae bacterium]